MNKKAIRVHGDRWCGVEIELKDGRLSICGLEGPVLSEEEAEEQARQWWVSFFDEEPGELILMNRRHGSRCATSEEGADFVLKCDGRFHGLDVHHIDGTRVFVTESCGQNVGSISDFFPELRPALPWHLNDMKAGCEHQEALGWGRGRTIALDRWSATEAQLKSLNECNVAQRAAELQRTLEETWGPAVARDANGRLRTKDAYARELDKQTPPAEEFEAEIFRDSIGAPCPTCGYRYGTQWLKRGLPAEIVELVQKFTGEDAPAPT